ncbi:MAG: hypothetical protein FWE22_02035 [Firmicutes bacterium]|nr:hypothetical protein [Bacillota bacterium]
MDNLQTYNINDFANIASAIKDGASFYIQNDTQKSIVLPYPVEYDFTKEERLDIDKKIAKGKDDFKNGRTYSMQETFSKVRSEILSAKEQKIV